MDKILTQDVWLPVELKDAKGSVVNIGEDHNFTSRYLQYYPNMVVITKEELEKIIGKAFDAGYYNSVQNFDYFDCGAGITTPDKSEYIKTLLP